MAAVFHIGDPQAGKSRLFAVLEEWFDSVDDVVAEHVGELLEAAAPLPAAGEVAANNPGTPVTVKSITLQSFTMPEFFARCSCKYPLVVFEEGDPSAKRDIDTSLYKGRAFKLDEAYEFWVHLDLTGKPRGDKDGAHPFTRPH